MRVGAAGKAEPFHLVGHFGHERTHRGLHEPPEPAVNPWRFIGPLEALPVGEYLDDPRATDLDTVGSERRDPGVHLAVNGLDEHRWTIDRNLFLDPLGRDHEYLTDLEQVRIRDPVGPHELVHGPVEPGGNLPETVARFDDHCPRPLVVTDCRRAEVNQCHAGLERGAHLGQLSARPSGHGGAF